MPAFTRLAALSATLALALAAASALAADTMKAVRIHAFGGPEVLTYEDAPVPTPAAGQVLVRVRAAGVNPVDWKIRSGQMGGGQLRDPLTLGYDVAGTVERVGEGVSSVKAGDPVFAYLSLRRGGGYAEFALVAESELARRPKSIDETTAAAVPLAGLTAYQALVDKAELKPGQTVLIHAAAGGVGHFAVQIAKHLGARVIATASAANHDFLKELGADEVIDYRTQKFEDLARDVDVVLDPLGGETQDRSFRVLKKGGILVSIVQPPDPERLKEFGVRGTVFLVQPNGPQLATLAELIDQNRLKPHVSQTFPLAEAAKAQEASASGRTRGKIVLTVP